MRFHRPQCFAATQNFKCIVGRRLGLPSLYKVAVLIATRRLSWLTKVEFPMVRMIVVVACSLAVLIGRAAAQDMRVSDDQAELQKNFAEAYNRKDADAMAGAFAEDGIRVTP